MSRGTAVRKFLRFVALYGFRRSFFKAAGRLRMGLPVFLARRARADIGMIGCGQFAFATIGYFLQRAFGRRVAVCYDIDEKARLSFARAFGVGVVASSVAELLATPGLRLVYIASNHASHTPYAVAAIRAGLDVYIEKPISVSRDQLVELLRAMRGSGSRVFVGYNRPFSQAIRDLRQRIGIVAGSGFSLQCFVSGHQLGPDHWYRDPREGTRVCGNIGHWLDLLVHVLAWRSLPDRLDISLAWVSEDEPDDNVSITIASDRGDLFSIMLASRTEPFEGINETINLQHGDTICKIDDFRRLTLWRGERLVRRRFWPKDVGHGRAILQPFRQETQRDWQEVVLSTLLMLHITDMVRGKVRASSFSFTESWAQVSREVGA